MGKLNKIQLNRNIRDLVYIFFLILVKYNATWRIKGRIEII